MHCGTYPVRLHKSDTQIGAFQLLNPHVPFTSSNKQENYRKNHVAARCSRNDLSFAVELFLTSNLWKFSVSLSLCLFVCLPTYLYVSVRLSSCCNSQCARTLRAEYDCCAICMSIGCCDRTHKVVVVVLSSH